jgi:adenylyltransferase/sulfurtransferase
LNRTAILRKVPFIHGGISGLHGVVTTILPGKTPCLRCIFAEGPPPGTFPVIGVTPGIIGLIQATEAIKYLTGIGELLTNRLLLFDGETMTFRQVQVKKCPTCPDCCDLPTDNP